MKEGDLRVWWAREVPIKKSHYYPVEDVESALGKIDKLAEEDLRDESIISNIGGLQIFKNKEWIDWEDEEGNFFEDIERMSGDEQEEYFKKGETK